MRDQINLADPGAAKAANGPYPSADLFLNSAALAEALNHNGGTLLAFGDVMRPRLAVRSDTFRVRACGESVNPANAAQVESVAWCEAIVQRIKDDPGGTKGPVHRHLLPLAGPGRHLRSTTGFRKGEEALRPLGLIRRSLLRLGWDVGACLQAMQHARLAGVSDRLQAGSYKK
ncbi:MAG: hypothetical protein WDM96_12250 [Lacunisphaera sp.]